MIKYLFTLSLSLIFTNYSYSQSTECAWAQKGTGSSDDYNQAIAADASGNVFVVGHYASPTITFGSVVLTNSDSGGTSTDVFIVKYDSNGNVLWAKSAGQTGDDYAQDVAADNSGNLYVTGDFGSSQINFGSTNLSLVGFRDLFLVKLDVNGNELWAKSGSTEYYAHCNNVAIDGNNDVIISGDYQGSTFTIDTQILTDPTNDVDVYVVKFNSSGVNQWSFNSESTGECIQRGLSVDQSNNILITGYFRGTTMAFGTENMTNADAFTSSTEIFVAKLDGLGSALWAKSVSGSNYDESWDVVTDSENNVYVTGNFMSQSIAIEATTLTNASSSQTSSDFFIAKWDSLGVLSWAKRAGNSSTESGRSMTVDVNDNIFLTGNFDGGTINFGNGNLSLVGSTDVFMVKYDQDGNSLQSFTIGENSYEDGVDICLDNLGYIYLTGQYYSSPLTFGTNNVSLTNAYPAFGEVYLAKFKTDYVGVNEIAHNSEFIVSPNPGNGIYSLSIQENSEITIYNSLGEIVLNQYVFTGENKIDLKKEVSGVYYLKIINQNTNSTLKLIKE